MTQEPSVLHRHMHEEGPLVFPKHLAQGSRGSAGVQRAETHLADAVMGSGMEE